MSNLDTALTLAARGWFVFPCNPDKTPLTPHGFRDATTDPAQIARWWKQYPDALVGIACAMSGFFAVDVDDTGSWNRFETTHSSGSWEPGPMQRTPRGGFHLIFRLPVDINIPNNAGKLALGVDLRSNGYICTGKGYDWMGYEGMNRRLVDPPAWLLEAIDKLNPHEEQAAQIQPVIKSEGLPGYFLEKAVRTARVGNRNNTGFELAVQLRDSGLSEGAAGQYMIEYAGRVPQGKHPYTEFEALASLEVAYRRPARPSAIPGYGRPAHE